MKINQKKYPFTIGDEIQTICKPLFQITELTHFEYIKSFADGSFITLTNNLPWLECYLKEDYFNVSFTRHAPNTYEQGYILTSSLMETPGSTCVIDAALALNIYDSIALIEPGPSSCEFYLFGSSNKNSNMLNFYLNNLDLLKKFTYYFHDMAEKMIAKHTMDKFKSPLILQGIPHPQHGLPQPEATDANLFHPRYPLFNNRAEFLTKREIECIYWLSQGKSSEEIGIILNLSKRTIETHILHAKKKLNCYKTTQLIYLAQKQALI